MKAEALLALFSKMLDERLDLLPPPARGMRGLRGKPGANGEDGKPGRDGQDFVFSDHVEQIRAWAKEFALKFSDLDAEQIQALRGPRGKDGIDGKPGADGKSFTFADLNAEQIQALRGPRGRDGVNGKDGVDGHGFVFAEHQSEISNILAEAVEALAPELRLKFEDLDEEAIKELRGPRGQRGKPGKSFDFEEHEAFFLSLKPTFQDFTPEERESLKLHFADLSDDEREQLKLRFEHLTDDEKLTLRGPRGQRGKAGTNGQDGERGPRGARGVPGVIGVRGLAGANGVDGADGVNGRDGAEVVDVEIVERRGEIAFVFTMSDGRSLRTAFVKLPASSNVYVAGGGVVSGNGSGGGGPGTPGAPGADGKSAYQIWLDLGNTGTEDDFIASLKGEKGDKGDSGTGGGGSIDQVLYDVVCDESVFVGAAVRMAESNYVETHMSNWDTLSEVLVLNAGTYDSVAVNASAMEYRKSNVIGIAEEKPTATTCNVRIAGITKPIFYGLDVAEEYYLGDMAEGRIVPSFQAPEEEGHVLLKLGQPVSFDRLLVLRGERIVRGGIG